MSRFLSNFRPLAACSRYRLVQRTAGNSAVPLVGGEPPNGFLFNERPVGPGERREKESWENWWVYGLTFNFLLILFSLAYKPDTFVSTWARVEALQQMKEEEDREAVGGRETDTEN